MGHYAYYVVNYEGEHPEPVLKAVMDAIDGYPDDHDTYDKGGFVSYNDAPQDQDEITDILTPLSEQFDTTFKIAYQDNGSEGMYNFYVGKKEKVLQAGDHFEELETHLTALLLCSLEDLLEMVWSDPNRLGHILTLLDNLETILRSPSEPVLK